MDEHGRVNPRVDHARPFRNVRQAAAIGLLSAADALRRRFDALYAPYGITSQQYNVLRILRGARPRRLATMAIAERMIERTPGITRLLDRLEEKGLVSRERSAEDRRCVYCTVTAAGLELLEELDEPVNRLDDEVVSMLKVGELRRLVDLLGRIRAGNE